MVLLPHESGHLQVSELHNIYWECYGNSSGVPVLVFHGGPGSGMDDYLAKYFMSDLYRVIFFDQRGCGKSTPLGAIENNTTQDLIADASLLLDHFGIASALIVGGSWGSTLAIEFAKINPDKCRFACVYSVFAGRVIDDQWTLGRSRLIFPDYWDRLESVVGAVDKKNPAEDLWNKYEAATEQGKNEIAGSLSLYLRRLLVLEVTEELKIQNVDEAMSASIKIFLHYARNAYFLPTCGIYENMEKLHDTPGLIIHGRYDMDSPLKAAYDLHKSWPRAELHIIPQCGHSDKESGIKNALMGFFASYPNGGD